MDDCIFVYSGRGGGRKGAECGRPEADHCHGPGASLRDDSGEHADDCRLSLVYGRGGRRTMVHHPFHRSAK